MTVPAKVSMSFLRKNAENQLIDGESICNGVEANQDKFTKLPDSIANYSAKNTEMKGAVVAAKTGDKKAGETLKRVRKEWIDMYSELANFISYNASGNAELIVACGFKVTRTDRKKQTSPDMLQDVKAAPGQGKGKVSASCKAQKGKGIKGYVAVAATPDTKVTMNGKTIEIEINGVKAYVLLSGKKSVDMEGLQSNQPLCVSMVTFNSAGTSPLAPSIEVTPQ